MEDDRITCPQCIDLGPEGHCRVAMRRSRLDVRRDYKPPQPYLPWRCPFFRPLPDAEDQTPGRVRFDRLWAEYKAKYLPDRHKPKPTAMPEAA